MITKEELLKEFLVTEVNEEQRLMLDAVYDRTVEEFEKEGVFFLKEEFLTDIQEKYHPFTEYYDYVKERLASLVKRKNFCLFSLLLHRMIEYRRDNGAKVFPMFARGNFPEVEKEVDFEFTGFFAGLAFSNEMADFYLVRGLPMEYFSDTLHDMYETAGIYAYSLSAGRLGYNNTTYFSWNQYYIYHKIVKIGELNFEVDRPFHEYMIALKSEKGEYKMLAYNKGVTGDGRIEGSFGIEGSEFFADFTETSDAYIGYEIDEERGVVTKNKLTLPKNEWSVVIRPGDNYLNVHIPRKAKIDSENNEKAYREALRLHKIMFPDETFKVIGCCSWLISPDLENMLAPTSSIMEFQNRYRKYPIKASGKAVFGFVFPKKVEKYELLAEDTSLQRKIKERYLNGGYIAEGAGIIFADEIE